MRAGVGRGGSDPAEPLQGGGGMGRPAQTGPLPVVQEKGRPDQEDPQSGGGEGYGAHAAERGKGKVG